MSDLPSWPGAGSCTLWWSSAVGGGVVHIVRSARGPDGTDGTLDEATRRRPTGDLMAGWWPSSSGANGLSVLATALDRSRSTDHRTASWAELRGPGVWAELVTMSAGHLGVGLECFGVSVERGEVLTGDEHRRGVLVPFGLELVVELAASPPGAAARSARPSRRSLFVTDAAVDGVVLVGHDAVEVTGAGRCVVGVGRPDRADR
ncbi:MAG: hypothetical protein R2698_06560 [Microthrixaceae bacterium]